MNKMSQGFEYLDVYFGNVLVLKDGDWTITLTNLEQVIINYRKMD